jgi:hypothetical protein
MRTRNENRREEKKEEEKGSLEMKLKKLKQNRKNCSTQCEIAAPF